MTGSSPSRAGNRVRGAFSAVLVAAVLISGIAAIGVREASAAVGPTLVSDTINPSVIYANQRGYRAAVTVIDNLNGKIYGAGDIDAPYPAMSVVKLFIATYLLASGQMHGTTSARAYKMITQSDDAIASAFWFQVGGPNLITWVQSYYAIPNLGSPPLLAGWWGNTKITARGMAVFLNRMRRDPRVGPWLVNAMRHTTATGSDGFDQRFGIKAAQPSAPVKQGWGSADDSSNSVNMHSVGYVDGDRYSVVIYTQRRPFQPFATARNIINGVAKTLMPGGKIPNNEAAHNPVVRMNSSSVTGGDTVKLVGWTADPDSLKTSLTYDVYEGSRRLGTAGATVPRPDVNKVVKIPGNHGYVFVIKGVTHGSHVYCVRARNIGRGTASGQGCVRVNVNQYAYNPKLILDSMTFGDGKLNVAGWTLDLDAPTTSGLLVVYTDGKQSLLTKANTTNLSVNAKYKVTGMHGYQFSLPVTAGRHTYCVSAVNYGKGSGRPKICRTLTTKFPPAPASTASSTTPPVPTSAPSPTTSPPPAPPTTDPPVATPAPSPTPSPTPASPTTAPAPSPSPSASTTSTTSSTSIAPTGG